MEKRTDRNSYTIIFAVIMVVVVGSLLAFAASGLKDKITENKRMEKQQNILYAMGINENDESSANFVSTDLVGEMFSKYITHQYIIEGTEAVETKDAYLIDVKKEKSLHKEIPSKRRLPLFVGEKDGETVYVVPVYGKGLWDAIWGYISVDKDLVVQGVYFDHKGETPGLGANIKERYFMDDFAGEHLLNESGVFKGITVAKGNADPNNVRKTDNAVDALAGATITGDGVTAMIKSDMRLYVPYFKAMKK